MISVPIRCRTEDAIARAIAIRTEAPTMDALDVTAQIPNSPRLKMQVSFTSTHGASGENAVCYWTKES